MNSIDIKKLKEERIEETKNHIINNFVEYDENNYELKVSLINVDSRFRNKIPRNIIDSNPIFLNNNPITTTKDSNTIKIYYKNHDFSISDRIILKNVTNSIIKVRNPIYLLLGLDYYILNISNHGIQKENTGNINDFKINITLDDTLTENDRMIGNIPLNSIIGIHSINILDKTLDANISDDNVDKLTSNLNISRDKLSEDYIFIKLPFIYSNENRLNNSIVFNEFENIKKIFSVKYLNIGGIPINFLNADFPINYTQYKSSHEIIKIEDDYFYFNCDKVALFDEVSGGDKVYVGKIINTIEGYPDANNYTIDLKKTFTNIVRMELVTSEVPYIDFNIKSNINQTNNKIFWKYLEDGDFIYSTKLDEGNYIPTSLIDKLKNQMNTVERISSRTKEKVLNIFDITFNSNSQEITFSAFKKNLLPNSLTIEKDINLGGELFRLNIKHANSFINVGDEITISGSTSIGDIKASLINTTHIVYEVNRVSDIYTVLISIDTDKTYDDVIVAGTGGVNVRVQIPAKVSFLFDRPNTLGNILGFKNVGSSNAVTKFQNIISNFDDYVEPIIYDEVGNTNPSNSLINLNGVNYYLLLYINDFEGIVTNADFDNAFSKILLTGNSGDIMFNTFVNSPLEFDTPVSSLEQLKIRFLFPDGTLPDFRNFDHSFTLRVVEKLTKPYNTRLDPNKITYTQSLIDKYN
jgi:hypothetical protein